MSSPEAGGTKRWSLEDAGFRALSHFRLEVGIMEAIRKLVVQPACPPPLAVSYRVGEPAATGGRLLAIWRRPLAAGVPLPLLRLALTVDLAVPIDLEQTYSRAAADAYLS